MLGALMVLAPFAMILMICVVRCCTPCGPTGLLSQDPETLTLTPGTGPGASCFRCLAAGLLVPVLMAITFAPALIFSTGRPGRPAGLSFRGCLRNMWPFLWWGLLGAVPDLLPGRC